MQVINCDVCNKEIARTTPGKPKKWKLAGAMWKLVLAREAQHQAWRAIESTTEAERHVCLHCIDEVKEALRSIGLKVAA
jgi:hypothetical protein